MGVLKTVAVALAMFSRIPMPRVDWDERNMRYMLCAFPLVGAVIGALLVGWTYLSGALGFGRILFAAGVALIPAAVTGGIHLDGFCDTVDALASHAPPERRREILKDPHAGAFAVIAACAYMLAYFALATEARAEVSAALLLGLMHVLSRTMSGLAVLCFPESASKGLLSAFRGSARKKRAAAVLFALFAAAAACMIYLNWPAGAVMLLAALLCFLWLRIMARRRFGGMSGDLAGWFLQTAELCMLAALIFTEKAAVLL